MNGNTTRQDLFIFRGTYRECMLEPTKDMHIYLAWDTGEIFVGNKKGYKVRYGANTAEVEALVKKYENAIKADLKKEYQDKLIETLINSPVEGAQAIIENMATKDYVDQAVDAAVEDAISVNIQDVVDDLTNKTNNAVEKVDNLADYVTENSDRITELENASIPDTTGVEEGWVLTNINGVPTWAKPKGGGAPIINTIELSAIWQPAESKIEISSGSVSVKVTVSAAANADKITSLKLNDTTIALNSNVSVETLSLTTPKSRVYTITGTTNDDEYVVSSLSKTLTVYQPSLFYADDVEEKRESYLGNYSLSSGVHYYLYIPTDKSINKILTSDGFGYTFAKEANQVQMTVNGVVADYWKYDLNAPYMDVDIVIS